MLAPTLAINSSKAGLNRGLLVHYIFRQTGGTQVADWSGNRHHGTIGGNPTFGGGRRDGGMIFDGTGDQITLTQNSKINNLKNFTIAAWIFPTTITGSNRGIIQKQSPSNPGLFACMINDAFNQSIWFASNALDTPGNWSTNGVFSTPVNVWTHIAVTYSYDNPTSPPIIYINGSVPGALFQHQAPGGSVNSESRDLVVGQTFNSSFFIGTIDDVRFYNRILSSAEVLELYRL